MKLAALGIKPGLPSEMVSNDVMAIMTVFRIITVGSIQIMALIADGLIRIIIFMLVVIAMNPIGFRRCLVAA